MTQILDWRPEPGEVVEFELTTDRVPEPHDVPASHFQRVHLRLAADHRASGRRQSPWAGVKFDLPGRADLDALTAAWQGLVRRHEAFHTWYEPDADGLPGFRLPPGSLTVRPSRVGDFTDPAGLRAYLHRRIDEQTAVSWPGLTAGVIRRDTSSTVYFAVDHAYTDGHSLALLFDEIRTRYQAALGGAPAGLAPAPGYLDCNLRERDRSASLTTAAPELAVWSEFLAAGGGGFPDFPVGVGNDADELLPGTRVRYPVLTGDQARAFRAYCARHGGGFGAGAFAALALAQREFTGNDVYRVLTVVSTRAYPQLLQVHGWLVNFVPLLFRLPASPTLPDAIAAAQQGFQRARAGYDVPMYRAIELLGGDVPSIPPMVSYLDGRSAPGSRDYLGADATVLAGPDNARGVSLWINWFPDRADLVVNMPDTAEAAAGVPKYVDRVREIMLARSGR
ncbi:condensation domain-containing protein [Streptomyces albireticuli]|nr:condensation domain-containing protein [Streptomyces albireticuli]MCD9144925.1 condensation domain-containing protein [Streptomyces albireticuli]MCD9164351.1 condensation domain-containing protein [Streptomyces albireticuli]MCD9194062.1 condensation domain-containing protein [Streptomyces albireticuli]